MTISALYLYPIKSLGGISVSEAVIEEIGFQYDRRFMLVTPGSDGESARFITQRDHPQMARIDVAIRQADEAGNQLHVWHRDRPAHVLRLPLTLPADQADTIPVTIWASKDVPAVAVSAEADAWFSDALGQPCRLVFMPTSTRRAVDPDYAHHDAGGRPSAVSFADGYPYLLIGQASLDDLNQRLADGSTMEMRRFRPNIVVEGSVPYDEDSWHHFRIGELDFYGVKPCARCVLTTIDPTTGEKGKEPLRTLATYRQWKRKILFGQNVLPASAAIGAPTPLGRLQVGQPIEVISRQQPWLAAPPSLL